MFLVNKLKSSNIPNKVARQTEKTNKTKIKKNTQTNKHMMSALPAHIDYQSKQGCVFFPVRCLDLCFISCKGKTSDAEKRLNKLHTLLELKFLHVFFWKKQRKKTNQMSKRFFKNQHDLGFTTSEVVDGRHWSCMSKVIYVT